jgi:hypothetical protein
MESLVKGTGSGLVKGTGSGLVKGTGSGLVKGTGSGLAIKHMHQVRVRSCNNTIADVSYCKT